MAYIGKACRFSQRLIDGTDSPFCSDKVVDHSQRVVKVPVKLNKLREDIRSYDGPSPPRPADVHLDAAIKLAHDSFSLPAPINPIHLNDFPRADWDKWHTSPGLPWKNLGFKDKYSVAKDIKDYRWVRCYWHKIKDGNRKPPFDCDAYLGSIPVENEKVRVIWGYPATTAFQEACFAIPLNRECKKLIAPVRYDNENIRNELRNIYTHFEQEENFLSFEYENFEKIVPAWLIRIAFNILLKNLDLTKYAERGIPDPDKLLNAWKYAVYYFINTPIRLFNGERYRKRRGIPNGSSFAELVGSVVNYIVTTYALLKSGNEVKDMVVCGSSTLACTSSPVNVEEFVASVAKCGLLVDGSKIKAGNDIKAMNFLGYSITDEVVNEGKSCENPSSCSSQPIKDQNVSSVDSSCVSYPDSSIDGTPPCYHRTFRTNSLPPFIYNDYEYNWNAVYDMHHTASYYLPYVTEMNILPPYDVPLFMPLNVQY
ncbi:uncharacterized protein [Anabrus simplex]|uniref:uncharacterized protein n=1 Tax=Anabrus simplex TaxID=316456 RepID=UPI0035A392C5